MKFIITLFCFYLICCNDINAQQLGTMVVQAKEDAHCEGGTSENNNYGTDTSIRTKNTSTSNSSYNRKSYLKFDLSEVVRENVGQVNLKLYPNLIQGANYSIDLFESANNWNESTITWANSPAFGTKITSFPCGSISEWSLIDISNYALSLPLNTTELSFGLYVSVLNSNNQILWNSKEAAANRPAIEFVYKANPPTNVTATVVSPSQIDLAWDKTACNASSFLIERKKGGEYYSSLTEISGSNDAKFSDLTIDSKFSYTYRITAINVGGINANPVEVSTIGTQPYLYIGSTCSHPQYDEVLIGSNNNPMLLIEIEMQGSIDPYKLNTINLGFDGTESLADIASVNVFYTGNSPVFATDQHFGISMNAPISNEMTVNGNLALVDGKNYLWVAFSIPSNAVSGNKLDVQCNSIIIGKNVPETKTPKITAPNGHRSISPLHAETSILRIGETVIGTSSFNGTNVVSFSQDVLHTYKGYQYAVFWTNNKRVAVARKKVYDKKWEVAELTDYTSTNNISDNHYNISMGLCYVDGTIHLSYDHHNHELNYRVSVADLINTPQEFTWNANLFRPNRNYLAAGTAITSVTYPRFITKPNGDLLLAMRKDGGSGNSNSYLYEYNGTTQKWSVIGKFIDGKVKIGGFTRCAYFNGIQYDKNGNLHAAWCWRTTSGGHSNHDLNYAHSPDHGRTWFNTHGVKIATTGSDPLRADKPGLKVYDIPMHRSLMNQESMCIDSDGRVHVLNGIITDNSPDVATWGTAFPVHFYRKNDGTWQKNFMMLEAKKNRDQIICDQFNNVYIVLENNIYRASEAAQWTDWKVVAQKGPGGGYSGDGQVDKRRLMEESVLAIGNGKGSNLVELTYLVDRKNSGTGTGLTSEYFEGSDFAKKTHNNNSNIDLYWDTTSEEHAKANDFCIRFNGKLQTRYAEAYTIHLTASEKLRCWVNGALVTDEWDNTTVKTFSIQLPPISSHFHDIKIEAAYSKKPSLLKLEWESQRQIRSVVPQIELYEGNLSTNAVSNEIIPNKVAAFSVFPNPTNGELTLMAENFDLKNTSIHVADVYGRIIGPININLINNMTKLDISHLDAGIYFIRVLAENPQVIKILKK